jgi:hypothetical protein
VRPRLLLRGIVAIGLIALGLYLLVPGRNTFGNPAFERELQRCRIPGAGEIVRLYEGNGGATTAFWYTVTHEGGWSSPERQIFYTYSIPEIRRVECRKGAVEIRFWDGFEENRESLEIDRIRKDLRARPLGWWMGEKVERRGNPLRIVSVAAGGLALCSGVLLGLWQRRKRKEDGRIA